MLRLLKSFGAIFVLWVPLFALPVTMADSAKIRDSKVDDASEFAGTWVSEKSGCFPNSVPTSEAPNYIGPGVSAVTTFGVLHLESDTYHGSSSYFGCELWSKGPRKFLSRDNESRLESWGREQSNTCQPAWSVIAYPAFGKHNENYKLTMVGQYLVLEFMELIPNPKAQCRVIWVWKRPLVF